jgi:hypothetical protein
VQGSHPLMARFRQESEHQSCRVDVKAKPQPRLCGRILRSTGFLPTCLRAPLHPPGDRSSASLAGSDRVGDTATTRIGLVDRCLGFLADSLEYGSGTDFDRDKVTSRPRLRWLSVGRRHLRVNVHEVFVEVFAVFTTTVPGTTYSGFLVRISNTSPSVPRTTHSESFRLFGSLR